MNSKIIVLMAIVPLLLTAVGGTVFAATPSPPTGSSGNYSYGYNVTASTVSNLSYASDVGDLVQNTEIANMVTATSGSSIVMGMPIAIPVTMKGIVLDNATILNSGQSDVFMMVSNNQGSWVNYSLTSAPQQVQLDLNYQMSYMLYRVGLESSDQVHVNYWVYSVIINEIQFYVFSNSPGTVTGDNLSLHSSGYVFSGVITFSALVKAIGELKYLHENAFTYNNTTGAVTGKYLSFDFNQSDGIFSGFTKNAPYPVEIPAHEIFTQLYATGNGNLSTSSQFPAIPMNNANVFGDLFIYANNTSIFAVHDNPALQTNMILDNGSLHFMLAPGLKAKVITTAGDNTSVSRDQVSGNSTSAASEDLGMNGDLRAGPSSVVIYGDGFLGYMFLHGATANVSGSNITVTTSGLAGVSFVSPPGLQWSSVYSRTIAAIEWGIEHGRIGAIVDITGGNGTNASVMINFNSTVRTSIVNVTSGKAVVDLSAAVLHHEGTNVLIYIANSVITNNSNIKVTFDGVTVGVSSLDGVLNTTSSTSAYFAEEKVPGGLLIVLHVPHFSSHTLAIYSTASQSPSGTTGGKLLLLGGAIAVIVVIAAVAFALRKKNN